MLGRRRLVREFLLIDSPMHCEKTNITLFHLCYTHSRHIHFHRAPSYTLVLLKHPPKPNIITPPSPLPHSFFPPLSLQPGNLTAQAHLLGFLRLSGQSTPTVVARRWLFGNALEVPSLSLVDPTATSFGNRCRCDGGTWTCGCVIRSWVDLGFGDCTGGDKQFVFEDELVRTKVVSVAVT